MPQQSNPNRRRFVKGIGAGAIVGIAGCLGDDDPADDDGNGDDDGDDDTNGTEPDNDDDDIVRAAWIHNGEVDTPSWSGSHDDGREIVDEEFDWLETSFSELVPAGEGEETAMSYIESDYDVIYGATSLMVEPLGQLAPEEEDTVFEIASALDTQDNQGAYDVLFEEMYYLIGAASGLLTENDRIGHITGLDIEWTRRIINGLAEGAKSVNPDVEIDVRFMEEWFNPQEATSITESIIADGADAMTQLTDSPAAVQTAASEGVWASGVYEPMQDFGGDYYVTGALPRWEVFYRESIESYYNDEWEPQFWVGGFEEDAIDMEEWGPQVPDDVIDEVEGIRADLEAGELNIWEGTQYEDWDQIEIFRDMDEYVDGVLL